jgi:ParB-like chromosome segregation protein Spo0J
MGNYQFLPSLTLEEYEALRESIRENGVIEPVIVDEKGAIIDGHHRVKACEELGIEYPTRALHDLSEEQKQDLSLELNLTGRDLTKDQKKEVAVSLFEQGWTQERIALRMKINQSTVSRWLSNMQMHNTTQRAQTLNQDEFLALKIRVDEAEKQAKELKNERELLGAESEKIKTALREITYDRNLAREESRAMAQELEKLKNAAPEPQIVEVKIADANITAEKLAELERAKKETETARKLLDEERQKLERERQRDAERLQGRLDKKAQEIEEAAAKRLDLKKLEAEYRLLESKKLNIESEIKAASIVEKLQRRLRAEHDAFTHGAAVLQIVTQEILERDDCGGLSVEELEQLERDIAKVGICVKELIPAIHTLIEKIKKGGALRIV